MGKLKRTPILKDMFLSHSVS